MNIEITVFTPTYNRGYIIGTLYKSLLAQTNVNFEWIVIDDGSIDNTEEFFNALLKKDNPFVIRYFKKENGGKHRAINEAVKNANGRLFFIVDSDDKLTPDSIDTILYWESTIKSKGKYAGVAGLRGHSKTKMMGTTFEGEWLDCTSLDRDANNIKGDKAEVFYTYILKRFPFPVFENETFVEESIVWNRIAESGYKIRWFNKIIYLCKYREDGLTYNLQSVQRSNPHGYAYSLIHNVIRHGTYSRRDIINIYYHYWTVVRGNITIKKAAKYLEISLFIFMYVIVRCKIRDYIRKWESK